VSAQFTYLSVAAKKTIERMGKAGMHINRDNYAFLIGALDAACAGYEEELSKTPDGYCVRCWIEARAFTPADSDGYCGECKKDVNR
jgi:hypothetical protein